VKTTIDIPDDELKDAIRFTGAKTKRDAVVTALVDFNRRKRMAELVQYSGTFTGMMSNEEIEQMERERMRLVHGKGFGLPPEHRGDQVAEDTP